MKTPEEDPKDDKAQRAKQYIADGGLVIDVDAKDQQSKKNIQPEPSRATIKKIIGSSAAALFIAGIVAVAYHLGKQIESDAGESPDSFSSAIDSGSASGKKEPTIIEKNPRKRERPRSAHISYTLPTEEEMLADVTKRQIEQALQNINPEKVEEIKSYFADFWNIQKWFHETRFSKASSNPGQTYASSPFAGMTTPNVRSLEPQRMLAK